MVIPTPLYGFPIPEMDDPPDGVGQLTALANAVEAKVQSQGVVSWTPVWDSSGSPKPSLPSALTGRYTVYRGWCDFTLMLQFSSSTTGGAGQWRFQLPFTANPAIGEQLVYGKLFEPQVANFPTHGIIFGGGNLMWCYAPNGPLMKFDALMQRDGSNAPGTQIPTNSPGPVQAGGNLVYTGRYLIA